jgi:hypothetical protein
LGSTLWLHTLAPEIDCPWGALHHRMFTMAARFLLDHFQLLPRMLSLSLLLFSHSLFPFILNAVLALSSLQTSPSVGRMNGQVFKAEEVHSTFGISDQPLVVAFSLFPLFNFVSKVSSLLSPCSAFYSLLQATQSPPPRSQNIPGLAQRA